jgi:plastocyanin
MERKIVRMASKRLSLLVLGAATLLAASLSTGVSLAQADGSVTHTIFVTGMEVKGATTADELTSPSVNPKDLSKGYGFKAPGEVDKKKPQKWQVASYMFTPSFVTVHQGDTVKLTVFIVNGNKHEVYVTAPDGKRVVPAREWNRGREYKIQFVAKKAGTYQLICSEHAPSMTMTFLVLPR